MVGVLVASGNHDLGGQNLVGIAGRRRDEMPSYMDDPLLVGCSLLDRCNLHQIVRCEIVPGLFQSFFCLPGWMERLRRAGYAAPFTSIEEGIGRYVRDYLSRADPYR